MTTIPARSHGPADRELQPRSTNDQAQVAMSQKLPAERAQRKQESRHLQWWYPKRCELEGCDNMDNLLKCGGCNMVQYCCKEHQTQDWAIHKSDCKVFKRLGLRATFYTDDDMLTQHPLQPPLTDTGVDASRHRVPRGASCPLCLKTDQEERLTRTRCCGNVVCDTSHRYQMLSYSREFCERSHNRYTLCGHHGVEPECDKTKDWRECQGCVNPQEYLNLADRLWRGLNAYNFCPMLSKDVPRHSLCDVCDGCGGKFISGCEGSVVRMGRTLCPTKCGNMPRDPMQQGPMHHFSFI